MSSQIESTLVKTTIYDFLGAKQSSAFLSSARSVFEEVDIRPINIYKQL